MTGGSAKGGDVDGGAIYSVENLTLRDSIVTGNTASGDGGGIWIGTSNYGTTTIDGSTISSNVAYGGYGGGVYCQNTGFGTTIIENSTISGNTAQSDGGGIDVFNHYGAMTIQGSTISGNTATNNGGGVSASDGRYGTTTIQSSTVSGNTALNNGGGISAYNAFTFGSNGTTTIRNSTIYGNTTAGDGGGVAAWNYGSGETDIQNCTIASNGADDVGGGIYASGTVSLASTIIAKNTNSSATASPDIYGSVAASYCLIGDGTGSNLAEAPVGSPDGGYNMVGGSTNGVIDPLLGDLADNGGSTMTCVLLSGSPAIDAGSNPAGLSYDQRGAPFARVFGAAVDIGAYEAQTLSLVVTTADDELDSTYDPNNLSLREAIALANANPGADTITFDSSLAGQTITLTGGQLELSDTTGTTTITGLGADQLIVSGNNASSVFTIDSGATVEISGLTITQGYDASLGGGVSNYGALTIADCTISDNSSGYFGGGIYSYGGTVTITDSTIDNNSAADFGGGVFNDSGSTLTINNCTISNNSSGYSGGGIDNDGTATVANCTISKNSSDDHSGNGMGGGIENEGTLTITNSTVAENSAGYGGGGIWNDNGGTLIVYNSTIAANTNGGVYNNDSNSTTTLANTIVAGNSGYDIQGTATANYCLIEDAAGATFSGSSGNNITGVDPLLGDLADNGGPTQTMALSDGSPALNAGSNALIPSGVTTDQRGDARIVNNVVDIGAYESQKDTVGPTVTIGDPSIAMTASDSVTFTVTYADEHFSASTLSLTDIILVATDTASGTVGLSGSGTSYLITISGITGDGTLHITLAADTAYDLSGNPALGATSATFLVNNTAPTSSVAALPATETSTSFTVNWSGSDGTGGSGIASYNVYVSDNGGSYTLWQNDVTIVSATYTTGQNGHTYGFYSVATDNVGNVQATPGAAQASTTVLISVPTAAIKSGSVVVSQTGAAFVVTYTDAESKILLSTIDGNDVLVTGPNGYSQHAASVSAVLSADGLTATATYQVGAPDGIWVAADTGTYTMTMVAGQVSNTLGNFVAAGTLGTFAVTGTSQQAFALTGPTSGSYVSGSTVTITWAAANVASGSKISLCYDTDTTFNGGGTEHWIEVDGVVTADGTASYTWSTTGVAAGTYYVAGYLWNGANTFTKSHLTQAITITAAPAQSFVLSAPTSGSYVVGANVTITWAAANVASGSKISLCYDTDTTFNGNEKWIEVDGVTAADGTASYTWSTTGVAAGTYYVAGYLWNGVNKFTTSHLTQAVAITAAGRSPSCSSAPTSGTYTAGSTVTITWTAANVTSGSKISLCYDTDKTFNGNEKWIEVNGVTAADGTHSYTWNTTSVALGTYYVAGYLWNGASTFTKSHLTQAITITAQSFVLQNLISDTYTVGDPITITWTAANVTSGSKISLCYDDDDAWSGNNQHWIEVNGVMAIDGTAYYTWDTTGVTPGTYYIAGYLWNGAGAFTLSHLTTSFTINAPGAGNSLIAADAVFSELGESSATSSVKADLLT